MYLANWANYYLSNPEVYQRFVHKISALTKKNRVYRTNWNDEDDDRDLTVNFQYVLVSSFTLVCRFPLSFSSLAQP